MSDSLNDDIIIEQKENITPYKKEDNDNIIREDTQHNDAIIKGDIKNIKELKNDDIQIIKEKEYHINRDSDDDEIDELYPSLGRVRGGVMDRRISRKTLKERISIIQIKESTKHYVKEMKDFNKIQNSSKKGFDYNTQFLYSSYIGESPIYQNSWNNNNNNNNNINIDKKFNDDYENYRNNDKNKEYKSNNNDMINEDIPTPDYLIIPIVEEEKSDEKKKSKKENISKDTDCKSNDTNDDNDSKNTPRERRNSYSNRK
jgi:hypothetical protein